SMQFRWIPPTTGEEWKALSDGQDSFLMGSPETETGRNRFQERQRRVRLDRGFWMGQFEVTQAQWESVMGYNPSECRSAGPEAPVERVSWNDAQVFIRKLNATAAPPGMSFRLPADAEWEYACRAGSATAFHFGNTLDATQANFDGEFPYGKAKLGEYRKKTTPAGTFPPNAWGLHDMHGNVWEWCEDHSIKALLEGTIDPLPELPPDLPRIVRGGSWFGSALLCRSAYRSNAQYAHQRASNIGFRLVLQEHSPAQHGTEPETTPSGKAAP
ncbi:MAG: formylglycine-generating enzyme family protein, partial [Kiritimatiellia bacterium]|nr:formylglycine-generating enzyme family protein [Kiritimatiellia bacterium]